MRRHRLLAAVLNGIASPVAVFSTHRFVRLEGTDLERLRGDARRVGDDFKTVISREYGKYKASIPRKDAAAETRF